MKSAPQDSFERGQPQPTVAVGDLGRRYLLRRQRELRPGGFKSVRYSVELFLSRYGDRAVTEVNREDGREFLEAIAKLSPVIGKSESTRGLGLDQLVVFSSHKTTRITVRTQKRIWSQVNHFQDQVVYEGDLETNPFKSVLFDRKVRLQPYAVPTNEEVSRLLAAQDRQLHPVMLTCLLTGKARRDRAEASAG